MNSSPFEERHPLTSFPLTQRPVDSDSQDDEVNEKEFESTATDALPMHSVPKVLSADPVPPLHQLSNSAIHPRPRVLVPYSVIPTEGRKRPLTLVVVPPLETTSSADIHIEADEIQVESSTSSKLRRRQRSASSLDARYPAPISNSLQISSFEIEPIESQEFVHRSQDTETISNNSELEHAWNSFRNSSGLLVDSSWDGALIRASLRFWQNCP